MGSKYIIAVGYCQNLNLTMHEGGRSILYSSQLLLEPPRHHVCKEVEVYIIAVGNCQNLLKM